METRASYLIVGTFMLALIAGAIGFAMWITRANLRENNVLYYIYFTGSVAGLQNGSTVQLGGLPPGNVVDNSIHHGNLELIQVTGSITVGNPITPHTHPHPHLPPVPPPTPR